MKNWLQPCKISLSLFSVYFPDYFYLQGQTTVQSLLLFSLSTKLSTQQMDYVAKIKKHI